MWLAVAKLHVGVGFNCGHLVITYNECSKHMKKSDVVLRERE